MRFHCQTGTFLPEWLLRGWRADPGRDGFTEADGDDWLTISAVEHWSYCPRQYALIALEDSFIDDGCTAAGTVAHRRADDSGYATQRGVRVVRGMYLASRQHRLSGRADFVEFRGEQPYPVEMKSGRFRLWPHEALQLAAQALCLEEMTGQAVMEGAVYYRQSRRRRRVAVSGELRARLMSVLFEIRSAAFDRRLPPAVNDHRCLNCSLEPACLPHVLARPARIRGFYTELFHPAAPELG
ncbi:MAG: CRISPR-associated protein Cas4 [Candidatus Binataceae bacterium]